MELQKVKHELKVEEWRKLIYECSWEGRPFGQPSSRGRSPQDSEFKILLFFP